MKEIVFAGSGGQGVLTSGLIISDIAASEGINVTWVPSYGSAMRGGTANCTVKYCAENYIYNPSQEAPDLLLAMNEPSLLKFLPIVAPGGTVLIGDTVELPEGARQDVTYVKVNCTEIATGLGNPKGANIVMTGAIVKLMGDQPRVELFARQKTPGGAGHGQSAVHVLLNTLLTQSPSQKIGFVLGGELQVHEHIIVDIVPDGQGAGLPFRRFL